MEIVLDASAIIAVISDEPEGNEVIKFTQNAGIVCPNVISFEIANSLTRMVKKGIIDNKKKMVDLINSYKTIPIRLVENDLEKIIEISWNYKIYAYDAFYLEAAKSLNLPLFTFDNAMRKVGKDIGITILGG